MPFVMSEYQPLFESFSQILFALELWRVARRISFLKRFSWENGNKTSLMTFESRKLFAFRHHVAQIEKIKSSKCGTHFLLYCMYVYVVWIVQFVSLHLFVIDKNFSLWKISLHHANFWSFLSFQSSILYAHFWLTKNFRLETWKINHFDYMSGISSGFANPFGSIKKPKTINYLIKNF